MERNPEASASTRDEVLFIPAAMCEKSQVAPHNTKGDLTSQRRHEWSPKSTHNSRGTLSFPPQLHENYEILPFTLEKALLRCSISKESPRFPWNTKGSLKSFTKLQKFPKTPVNTWEERWVSHHKSRGAPFSLPQVEMRVDCPASPGKECWHPRHTLRGGWYLFDTGAVTRGLVTIQKPSISPSIRNQAWFSCTDSNVSRESTHNTKGVLMPRLLIRKEPQVPNSTRLEAWNPFDNSRRKQISRPPHTSRPDPLFETAYTARDPHQNKRGTLSLGKPNLL